MANRNFVVTVKETGEGRPYLLVELHEEIGLGEKLVAFDLTPGADITQAQTLARTLNRQASRVRLT